MNRIFGLLILMSGLMPARGSENPQLDALFDAISAGNTAAVKKALEAGADPEGENHDGQRPSCNAVIYSRLPVVRMLVEARRKKYPSLSPDPLIICAAFFNASEETVDFLVKSGADVNRPRSEFGLSPLMLAAEQGSDRAFFALLKHKARLAPGEKEMDLFFTAVSRHPKIAAWAIAREKNVNAVSEGTTALHCAAGAGKAANIILLLDAGADLHLRDSDGETPLFAAARRGELEAMKLLLAKGARVNDRDKKNRTALFFSLENLHDKTTEFLLSHGADVSIRDAAGNSPINVSVGERALKLLIARGADVNSQNKAGETLLHHAALRDLENIAAILFDAGADTKLKDAKKRRPIDLAEQVSSTKVLWLLQAREKK